MVNSKELKVFKGHRPDVDFDTRSGTGNQVTFLMRNDNDLSLANHSIRWILMIHIARYDVRIRYKKINLF